MPQTSYEVDMRPILPAIRDQGNRGTCLAFAVTAAHEVEHVWEDKVIGRLSEEVLFWGGRQFEKGGPTDSGGISTWSVGQALNKWGQPEASLWPYDDQRSTNSLDYQPPAEAIDPSNCFRASIDRKSLVLDICGCLKQGRAVVIAVRMAEQWYDSSDGWIAMPPPTDIILDNHAVLLVGFSKDASVPGGGYFIIRNSWSTTWGEDGYGYLPFKYFVNYGIGAWVVNPILS